MCGIAGTVSRSKKQVDGSILKGMTDQMKHRGPDGEGFFCENNIGLGHRRLAIIDTSRTADQPFFFGEELILIFNGAIYNYLELKEELSLIGYSFSTESDTEVLITAYKHWGKECVTHFNGMWAFVIYDRKEKILFCSRDRFGVKPFYYYLDDEDFVFASEIKPILRVTSIDEVDVEVLLGYLVTNLSDQSDRTFFKGILKLPAATNLIIDLVKDSFEFVKYYTIDYDKTINSLSLEDSISLVERELKRAIEYRLRSDVNTGAALSGGLDSSFIVAHSSTLLNQSSNKRFSAISIGSIDERNDESFYAKLLAKSLNVDCDVVFPDRIDFEKLLNEVIYLHEEPFANTSVYMQYFLMKTAKDKGIKVLLDGQGADTVLLGASRHIAGYIRTQTFYSGLLFLFKLKSHYGISIWAGLKNYFYFSNYTVRISRLRIRQRILKRKYRRKLDFSNLKVLAKSYSQLFDLQCNEIYWAQAPELLKWEEKNAMANSVETRLPYLDYKFVETCLSINNNFKIREGWSKYLLRRIMSRNGVIKEITWRRNKGGFDSPENKWWPMSLEIEKTIRDSKILTELLEKNNIQKQNQQMRWKLYNIAVWEKLYNIKINL